MWKKILFLDIDGVLASIPYLCKSPAGPYRFVDPEKCKILNQLSGLGVEIVISSSWGYDGGQTEKTLKTCGLELPIIGYTKHMHEPWLCRGNEIERWIVENLGGLGSKFGCDQNGEPYYRHNQSEDYEYVIIDDDCDMLLGQQPNFIQIDQQTGITEKDIKKIIKILSRDE